MPINKISAQQFKDMGEAYVSLPADTVRRLTANALAAYAFVVARGGVVDAAEVRGHYGWGDVIWRRVAKELRDQGLMTTEPVRDERGRIITKRTTVKTEKAG